MDHSFSLPIPNISKLLRPFVKRALQLAEPESSDRLVQEIQTLPLSSRYAVVGNRQLWIAQGKDIPSLLREIGRLREEAFRAKGLGSGNSRDLDEFDVSYHHLILWEAQERAVIGAYRFKKVADNDSLYTTSLFEFDPSWHSKRLQALELGRSFIRLANQNDLSSLGLLWKGIALWISKHPEIRYLFGGVSVDSTYGALSRTILVEYLRKHHSLEGSEKTVVAQRPFTEKKHLTPNHLSSMIPPTPDEVVLANLLSDAEGKPTRIPVLLKHYLKLGGKSLAFHVDTHFGDCLDVLVWVELNKVPERLLAHHQKKLQPVRSTRPELHLIEESLTSP